MNPIIFLQAGSTGGIINFVFIGAMILIFWLFLIRPQAKKQKEQTQFANAIQKGDDVVTASGILGKVNKVEDEIVTLEVGSKTYIRVTRGAISKEMTEQIYASKDKD